MGVKGTVALQRPLQPLPHTTNTGHGLDSAGSAAAGGELSSTWSTSVSGRTAGYASGGVVHDHDAKVGGEEKPSSRRLLGDMDFVGGGKGGAYRFSHAEVEALLTAAVEEAWSQVKSNSQKRGKSDGEGSITGSRRDSRGDVLLEPSETRDSAAIVRDILRKETKRVGDGGRQ
jgi:hypothetical protein